MSRYTKSERIIYNSKRQASPLVVLLLGLLLLLILADPVWQKDYLNLVAGKLLSVGIGVSLFLVISKFAFPKLDLQTQLLRRNYAVAIFAAGLLIALALLF